MSYAYVILQQDEPDALGPTAPEPVAVTFDEARAANEVERLKAETAAWKHPPTFEVRVCEYLGMPVKEEPCR